MPTGIRFTHYVRPNGRKTDFTIERPERIKAMADVIVAAGYALESEVLRTRYVSMTVERVNDATGECDVIAHELVRNGPGIHDAIDGPGIPDAVDRLIEQATREMEKRKR